MSMIRATLARWEDASFADRERRRPLGSRANSARNAAATSHLLDAL